MIGLHLKFRHQLAPSLLLMLVMLGGESAGSESTPTTAVSATHEGMAQNPPPAPVTPSENSGNDVSMEAATVESASPEAVNPTGAWELEQALTRYRQAIGELDAYGPYNEHASEALYGLGETLKNQGLYNEALTTLRRAMHVNRVNHGLYSLSQAPILESIIETEKALNLFEDVTVSYDRLLNLLLRNHGADHRSLIPVLQELALWHVSLYQLDDSAARVDHITSANSLINAALKNAEAAGELDTEAQIDLLRITALVSLFASRHEGDQWATALDAPYSASADPEFLSVSRMATLSKTGFKKGRLAHEQIIKLAELDEDTAPDRKIAAYVEAGDWYLLFNRSKQAMEYYQHARDLIAASDQAQTLTEQWFSEPVFLPAVLSASDSDSLPSRFITAEADISESGRPSQINLLEPSAESGVSLRRSALNTLRQARFRPRFADGKAVATTASKIRIPLVH